VFGWGAGPPNTTPLAYQWADVALTRYGVSPTSLLARTFHDLAKYSAEWRRTMGTGDYMFPMESQVADFEALNQSFLAWLEERQLYTLVPFIEWAIAAEVRCLSGREVCPFEPEPSTVALCTLRPCICSRAGIWQLGLDSSVQRAAVRSPACAEL